MTGLGSLPITCAQAGSGPVAANVWTDEAPFILNPQLAHAPPPGSGHLYIPDAINRPARTLLLERFHIPGYVDTPGGTPLPTVAHILLRLADGARLFWQYTADVPLYPLGTVSALGNFIVREDLVNGVELGPLDQPVLLGSMSFDHDSTGSGAGLIVGGKVTDPSQGITALARAEITYHIKEDD